MKQRTRNLNAIAKEISMEIDLPKEQLELIALSFVSIMTKFIREGDKVKLNKFGTFSPKPGRDGYFYNFEKRENQKQYIAPSVSFSPHLSLRSELEK